MRNSIQLFLGLLFITIAGINTTLALKDGDCEVCISTVENFGNTLDEATKKDPKKIENEFRKYCKTTKPSSKENRFVSSEIFFLNLISMTCK